MAFCVLSKRIAIACGMIPAMAFCHDVHYRLLRLPTLPDPEPGTYVFDINNSGVTSGYSYTLNSHQAVIWDEENGLRLLGNLVPGRDDLSETAEAINDSNQVAGVSLYPEGGTSYTNHAFIWDATTGMVGLGDLPGSLFSSWAKGINNLGHVVGYSWSTHYGEPMQEAFLWTPEAGMIGLGSLFGSGSWTSIARAINDDGWVTGWSVSTRGIEAFLWTAEDGMIGLGDLRDGPYADSDGFAINQSGQIAGIASSPTFGNYHAFLWTPGPGMLDLGVLPGHEASGALGLNDREQVVGWSRLPQPPGWSQGFIWDRHHGMRNLNDLLDPCVPLNQRRVTSPYAINNRGQLAAADVFLDPYLPGDLDQDGSVTLQDLANLLANFGRAADAAYEHGDLDCDREVDLQDLATLLNNFGQSLP